MQSFDSSRILQAIICQDATKVFVIFLLLQFEEKYNSGLFVVYIQAGSGRVWSTYKQRDESNI